MKRLKSFIYTICLVTLLTVPVISGNLSLSNGNESYEAMRHLVGCHCCDGWDSEATGGGACSHHGGVMYWKMSDGTKVYTGKCN